MTVRFWSANHYDHEHNREHNLYDGTITNDKTKEVVHFHSVAKLLKAIEKFYKEEELKRRKNEK